MSAKASRIIGVSIIYTTVCSGLQAASTWALDNFVSYEDSNVWSDGLLQAIVYLESEREQRNFDWSAVSAHAN